MRFILALPTNTPTLQKTLESTPAYTLATQGRPPQPGDAEATLAALPPGKTYRDKFVFLITHGPTDPPPTATLPGHEHPEPEPNPDPIGCVDLVRGYPDAQTAMLGLLLISEKFQRQNLGRQAYALVEEHIKTWPEIKKIRIGIHRRNDHVTPFWIKMGFKKTGEKPEAFVYEKSLT